MVNAFWLGGLKRPSKDCLQTMSLFAKWQQEERTQMITKRTSNPSAFELIVLQVLLEVLCAQSPAYHELAL